VPADRLPVRPLPPGIQATKVYMFYFGKRGGGIPQQPVPFEAPNELGLKPGDKARLWYFDESPRKGEAPNDWRTAGTGTVSADGRTIVSDPGMGIPKFCCGAALYDSLNAANTIRTTERGENTMAADPVDLSTGLFMLSATDLVLPGRLPLALTRSYRSADTNVGAFGLGTMMGYDEFLVAPSATVLTYVYHGDARTDFVQQPDGSYMNTTVPAFRGTTITYDSSTGTRVMRDKHGRSIRFGIFAYGIWLPLAVSDANGNQVTITRAAATEFTITGVTEAGTGRQWIVAREYGYGFRVASVTDPLGRTVSYHHLPNLPGQRTCSRGKVGQRSSSAR